ncbi:MAG: FAD-dependent oxidoreductase, partial [Pseudarthrobacter sp.]
LESEGIVESFPLPGGLRRWVVRLGKPAEAADAHRLAGLVLQRTGIMPDVQTNTMLSAFSVRSTLARSTVAGRALLIGDAAHEISPIGGQGMNLGWMAARALSPLIRRGVAGEPVEGALKEFEVQQLRAAVVARRQSEINMMLGRPLQSPFLQLRNLAIGTAASVPAINRWTARRFTMQPPRTPEGQAG